MTAKFNRTLIYFLLFNSLIACSEKKPTKNLQDKPTSTIANYDTKSCKYELLEGDSADFALVESVDFANTYFNKEYNQAHLNAILTTNISASIDFINQTGATVYKSSPIASQVCQRPLFAQATTLPKDLDTIWSNATGSHQDKDSLILGLYLPKTSDQTSPSLKSSAAIILRENTNRWTLVHEYMHHLFSQRAIELGYDQNFETSQLNSAIFEMRRIVQDPNKSDSSKTLLLAQPFAQYAKGIDNQMIHFSLEEITIEATLKKLQNQGALKYAPSGSNWYISVSAEKAIENYKAVEDLGYTLLLELPYNAIKERELIVDALSNISERMSEIESIRSEFPKEHYNFLAGNGLVSDDHRTHHEGCSHEEESNRLAELTQQVKKDLSFLGR